VFVQVQRGQVFGMTLDEVMRLQQSSTSPPTSPQPSPSFPSPLSASPMSCSPPGSPLQSMSGSTSSVNTASTVHFSLSKDEAKLPVVLTGTRVRPPPYVTAHRTCTQASGRARSVGQWNPRAGRNSDDRALQVCAVRSFLPSGADAHTTPQTNRAQHDRVPGKKSTMDVIRDRLNSGIYQFEEGASLPACVAQTRCSCITYRLHRHMPA
jgi:hypothetical protein